MTIASLVVTFDSQSSSTDAWLHLEQIVPSEVEQAIDLPTIHAMWLKAATGGSAQTMRVDNCPVSFVESEVVVALGFYAWPSRPDLVYSLVTTQGVLSPGIKGSKLREQSWLVDNNDTLSLPYYMLDPIELEWESPTFNASGGEIDPPTWTLVNGVEIVFSSQVFGVARVKGAAVGIYHTCTMSFDKSVIEDPALPYASPYPKGYIMVDVPKLPRRNSVKISNINTTITATWDDVEGEEEDQLKLVIPKCVQDIMALCPDMYRVFYLLCKDIKERVVYYNACTGDVIKVLMVSPGDSDDPTHICADVTKMDKVTANPWGALPTL